MVGLCENGHEVRAGMFVCPACGSENVTERESGQVLVGEHDEPAAVTRRRRAEQELTGFINRGVVFIVLGFFGGLVSVWQAAEGNGGSSGLFALGSWAVGAAGAAYLLCGIIGWGVKYGNEATARDGEPAGQA
jgi:RNA polymerase subunit RPABC4/transcription elongation factor Spt4